MRSAVLASAQLGRRCGTRTQARPTRALVGWEAQGAGSRRPSCAASTSSISSPRRPPSGTAVANTLRTGRRLVGPVRLPFRGASGSCPACALLPHLHRPSPLWQEHVVCLHGAVGWSGVREQRQPRCGRIHLQGARLQVDVGVRPRPRPAPPSPPPPPPAVSAAAARAGGPAPATMCMHDSPLSTVSVLFCWYLAPLPCAPLSICRPARVRRALGSLRRCSTPKELADAGPAVYLVHTPCACVLQ